MSASAAIRQPHQESPDADAPEVETPSEATERQESQASPQPPAAPAPMPPLRAASYMLASLLLALTQGLGMNLISANLPQIQGSLGATTNEATWLVAAYMAPNVSLALALIKIRTQYGLRNFAEISIAIFVLVSLMHLFVNDLQSALVVRFFSGIAAAPMSTLGFLYMLEPFPPAKKMNIGLCLALTNMSLGAPVARLIAPDLLQIGQWQGLYLFEIAIAMMAFAAVYMLPLTSPPRAKVIHWLDVTSYLFIAVGFGLVAMVLTLGRLYWWLEAPWLGVMLAGGIIAVMCAAVIELNRASPLLDIRWLASREVLHFTAVLLVFRVVLSEQTSGAFGFFQVLGLQNDQMATLCWVILAASVAGGLACAAAMKPGREPAIHMAALALLAAGAYMDSQATNLTRPAEMYLSQALIAVGGALFLPPALASGVMSALKKGPNYILSFVIVFLTTQSLGGLLGSAVVGTFITWREKFHSHALVEHVTLTNPIVAQRVSQLSGAYGRVLTDKTLLDAQGLALLGQQATKEANVLAYNDAFLAIAVLALFALAALTVHVGVGAIGRRLAPAPQPVASYPLSVIPMLKFLRSTATLVALVIGIAGAALVLYAWRLPPFTSSIETTDNAYVRGQITVISPQLAGYIAEVAVQDFQKVKAGQLLVTIDDRIFQQKLEQAKATLAAHKAALANSEQTRRSNEAKIKSSEAQGDSAKAALKAANASWERIEPLLSRGVTTQKEADQARASLDQAKAALSQAQAAVEVARQDLAATLVNRSSLEAAVQGAEAAVHLAEIDLQNTRIVAPQEGRLGEIGARVGQYVAAGTQLLAVVPETIWVVANFKETQLPGMKVGQPVTLKVDALEHASLSGRIERFSPAAGSEFSVLKADNATGNFTKVAQRVPVRIAIDPDQNLVERLAPGMSVEVSVNTEAPAAPKSIATTGGVALR